MMNFIRTNFQIIGLVALVLVILIVRIAAYAHSGRRDSAQKKRELIWERAIEHCKTAGSFRLTGKKLARFSSSGMLQAFDSLNRGDERAACTAILDENSEQLISLISGRTKDAERGFFAYILSDSDLSRLGDDAKQRYVAFALQLLSNDSVYCRENALKLLYASGNAEAVASAIETLSIDARLHNGKLLSDGMNSFQGDHRELASRLMDHFDRYDDHSQSAVISFFTAAALHDWDGFFKARLENTDISIDQRCDILRLLLKSPSEETKRILSEVLRNKGHAQDWQTAAVAATGLSSYPDDPEAIDALEYGITSPAWNVRINCAFSLVKMAVPAEILDRILNGSDAFAADALRFAINSKGLSQ